MMVKVLLYGDAVGVLSSRKLARKLYKDEDVAFRVLGAGNSDLEQFPGAASGGAGGAICLGCDVGRGMGSSQTRDYEQSYNAYTAVDVGIRSIVALRPLLMSRLAHIFARC
jgi:hypothetical protein